MLMPGNMPVALTLVFAWYEDRLVQRLSQPSLHLPSFKGLDFRPVYRYPGAGTTRRRPALDLDLRHNLLQEALYRRLALQYGQDRVHTEQPSGVGTKIDIVVKAENGYWFYEIKTALTPRACLREAIGQLLEYALWPGSQEPTRFIVVGEPS
jgi:hypothetical protein